MIAGLGVAVPRPYSARRQFNADQFETATKNGEIESVSSAERSSLASACVSPSQGFAVYMEETGADRAAFEFVNSLPRRQAQETGDGHWPALQGNAALRADQLKTSLFAARSRGGPSSTWRVIPCASPSGQWRRLPSARHRYRPALRRTTRSTRLPFGIPSTMREGSQAG